MIAVGFQVHQQRFQPGFAGLVSGLHRRHPHQVDPADQPAPRGLEFAAHLRVGDDRYRGFQSGDVEGLAGGDEGHGLLGDFGG